ncbi:MAG: hypothetical protein IIA83_00185 [Thaumarchaeota archaeon]|nr:hypothetical protein [Nitrososphaerota archaeon]
MKFVIVFLTIIISVSSFNAYGQEPVEMESEPIVMEQVNLKVPIKVQLFWPEVLPDEIYDIQLSFLDPDTDELLDDKTITFDIIVNTKDMRIETYQLLNTTSGIHQFEVLFPEEHRDSVEVIINILRIDDGFEIKNINSEKITFSVKVVPEFGVVAAIILSMSLVPIIFLSKSKLSTRTQ